jgi:hypothetical protein
VVSSLACGASQVLAQAPPAGAEAAAFIRVVGDFRAEYKRIWKLPIERRDIEIATGSGFVIAPSGLILTNHHVISGKSFVRPIEGEPAEVTMEVTRIEAVVGAGDARQTLTAALVAVDLELDLAVLSVTTAELPHLAFGDSDAVDPGQPARVLGFPFGRQVDVARPQAPGVVPSVTVTAGSVSASRSDGAGEQRYLQTDATVNPGSSGGPMLDAEGYAIGVVHSKLAKTQGAGFAIPINRVKDFLEANGLLPQLPARRLRLGAPQTFAWKGVRVALPEALDDVSRSRIAIAGGALLEEGALRIDRIATPLSLQELEQAFLGGQLDGVALTPRPRGALDQRAVRRARFGSASFGHEGEAMRAEYALVDLGKEKLVARFLARAPQVAFNLSVIQGSLRSLEGERLLTREVDAPLLAEWGEARLQDPRAPALPMPLRFVSDETPGAHCEALGAPDSLLSASPESDFSVVFRASFWARPSESLLAAARECPGEGEHTRFGIRYHAQGALVDTQAGLLRLEAEAPREKWPFVESLAAAWLEQARRTPR